MLVGGSFGLEKFAQLRYDFRKSVSVSIIVHVLSLNRTLQLGIL